MVKKRLAIYLTFLSLLAGNKIFSQSNISTENLDLEGDVLAWYDSQVGLQNTPLQIGNLNNAERKARRSHQYLESPTWVKGNINYRGQRFENIDLLYDIYADKLITKNNGNLRYASQPIELIKSQVSAFTIYDQLFEYIEEPVELFEKGFFEIMYRGENMEVLVKRLKVVEIESDGVNAYSRYDKYFLRMDGEIHPLRNRFSVLKRFPNHKKEIRAYLRKQGFPSFRLGSDHQLKSLAAYCDALAS